VVGGGTPPYAGLLAGSDDCDGLARVLGETVLSAPGVAAAGFPVCRWLATARSVCVPVAVIRAAVMAATAHAATTATTVAVPRLARILLQPTSLPSRCEPARLADRARLTIPSPDGAAVLSASAVVLAALISLSSIIRRNYVLFH
jgi:hypothetical protein